MKLTITDTQSSKHADACAINILRLYLKDQDLYMLDEDIRKSALYPLIFNSYVSGYKNGFGNGVHVGAEKALEHNSVLEKPFSFLEDDEDLYTKDDVK